MIGISARRHGAWKPALLLLLLPLVAACSASREGDGKTSAIDPPPADAERSMLLLSEGTGGHPASADAGLTGEHVTVYLEDAHGYLAPMTLRAEEEEEEGGASVRSSAETALAWLTEDPKRTDQLPEGFAPVLPAGTRIEAVTLASGEGLLSVDFAELPGMPARKERKMLEAVVWTMTELPGIDKVRLSEGGNPLRKLPASGLPVDDVLTRGIGINVEHATGVPFSRSMAVTLYFSAQSANGEGYFVPVTRLIDRTPDRMQAALQELIKGPQERQGLTSAFPDGITVEKMDIQADTVNVSLRDDDWEPSQTVPSDMMEALIHTVTEAAGAPQVKVAFNGTDTFLDSEMRAYDRPVVRPAAVNVPDGESAK